MWNDFCHGFSVLSDALQILSRSWGFWLSVGSVVGLAAVYMWWRRRLALWAFFLSLLSLLAVVGLACHKVAGRNSFLCVGAPEMKSLAGVYEVESSPRERWFFRPLELNRFFQVSSSMIHLHEDGRCEISSFPRRESWGWWIAHPEEREDLSVLEADLVSTYTGTWELMQNGGYYAVSVSCASGNGYTFYLGGDNAECLVMPVNPSNPLEAVTFEKVR